jgi:hypothetical protein
VRVRWQRRPGPPDCPWRRRPRPGSDARPPQSGPRSPHWPSAEKWMVPAIHSVDRSVADPHHIDAYPNWDPDPAVTLMRMRPDPTFHFDAVPDPDPSFQ